MNSSEIKNIGDKARKSVRWSFALQVIQKTFFFAAGIILARVLTPSDFGLATMSITFDVITWIIVGVGISSAVVHFQDNTEERLNAAFWITIIFSALFVGLQYLFAPAVAHFYKAPIMADIMRTSAIALFIFSFGAVQKTILFKQINFKEIYILETVVNTLKNVLYVVFALMGFGVWSFIYPKIICALISVVALWKISPWKPNFKFYFKYWKEMVLYGKDVVFSNIIDYSLNNTSYILIGNMLGPVLLGIYTFAYEKSMMVVNNIAYPITQISFSAFALIQDNKERIKASFFKTIKIISNFAFPYSIAQVVLGKEFITLIYGDKWASSVLLFQMIIIYSMCRAIVQSATPLLQAVGKADIVLKWNLIYAPIYIFSIFLGFKFMNLTGVALAATFIGSIGSFIYLMIVCRSLEWQIEEIIDVLKPTFCSSLLMGLTMLATKIVLKDFHTNDLPMVLILSVVGLATYYAAMKILFEDTFVFLVENIKKFIPQHKGLKNEINA